MVGDKTALTSALLAAAIVLGSASCARADVVTDWNQTAIRATEIAGAPVPVQTRVMAMVHAAMFDAVNAIERKYSVYAVDVSAPPGASADAAAAGAAHGILERLYPQQKAITDAALASSLARIPEGAARSDGARLGQEVATPAVRASQRRRLRRRAILCVRHRRGRLPGHAADERKSDIAALAQLEAVHHGEREAVRIRRPPRPEQRSLCEGFQRGHAPRIANEHRAHERADGDRDPLGRLGSSPLNAVGRAAATAKGLSLIDSARLFALLNMAMADSLIAGFEAKYAFNYWRPVTAIRNAGLANNAAIAAEPGWDPLLVTPPHPEYPSAHCLGAGAAVAVLQHVFEGDRLASSYVYPPLGVLLRWDSFSQIEKEVENARVWGGIHYRTSVEHGSQIGRQVGEFAVKTKMRTTTH